MVLFGDKAVGDSNDILKTFNKCIWDRLKVLQLKNWDLKSLDFYWDTIDALSWTYPDKGCNKLNADASGLND
jgi:hypothetical protein